MPAWPAHTMGDVYVYFPKQRAVSTGDLFLTNSVPAMDQGSAAHWIEDLDQMLALPVDHFVPGHFELAADTLQRFRDYMADLDTQVEKLAQPARAKKKSARKSSSRSSRIFVNSPSIRPRSVTMPSQFCASCDRRSNHRSR